MSKERASKHWNITESQFLAAMERIMQNADDEDTVHTCLGLIQRANNYLSNNMICDFLTDGNNYWIEPRGKGKIGFRT